MPKPLVKVAQNLTKLTKNERKALKIAENHPDYTDAEVSRALIKQGGTKSTQYVAQAKHKKIDFGNRLIQARERALAKLMTCVPRAMSNTKKALNDEGLRKNNPNIYYDMTKFVINKALPDVNPNIPPMHINIGAVQTHIQMIMQGKAADMLNIGDGS